MIKKYKIQENDSMPVVSAKLQSAVDSFVVKLIFDTGAAMTQLNSYVVDKLGFSARDAYCLTTVQGPAGPIQEGYALQIPQLEILGKKFLSPSICVYDLDNLEDLAVDGLLGFDLIKQFHLEMNGPQSELTVFNQ